MPSKRRPARRPPRRVVLRNFWSPGDIVMLTAAVRDLHRRNPGAFLTDVRTSCPALWENNPHITRLDETDRRVESIDCEYPLIHQSNSRPLHCLHGFAEFLAQRLGVDCTLTECRGDIHLSEIERAGPGPVEQRLKRKVPYWLVVAGGKFDYTIKWWETARYQAVVDHFRDRQLFVQVGDASHHHPRLEGVLDLRGRTDLREFVMLVHHSEGVLCPVTSAMHLAAAVACSGKRQRLRPCVVVAGGREPPTWEAYPGHQFIHTVGALPCCALGGCWRARTLPLRDGDELRDAPNRICLDVVDGLPRCMDLITAADVVRRIEMYLADEQGGLLTPAQARAIAPALTRRRGVRLPARRSAAGATVTICVFMADGVGAHWRRCLGSIRRSCSRRDYELRVVAAGMPDAVQHTFLRWRERGAIDRLHLAPAALDRATLVDRVLRDPVTTEFVWLLDGAAQIAAKDVLGRRVRVARDSGVDVDRTDVDGHEWFARSASLVSKNGAPPSWMDFSLHPNDSLPRPPDCGSGSDA